MNYYGFAVSVTKRGLYLVAPVEGGKHSLYRVEGTIRNASLVLVGGVDSPARTAAIAAHRIDNPLPLHQPAQFAPTAGSLGLQRAPKINFAA